METILSEIVNEQKTPKWLRYAGADYYRLSYFHDSAHLFEGQR